ncbi:MAG: uracil phosphoribosyltransferase [Vampirovibrio sp.]|nr:uracil phosphoribosyltransferase [Vampirovibrio sp.]
MTATRHPSVVLCEHALVEHNLGIIRHKDTPVENFRLAMARLGTLLVQEATRDLPLHPTTVETPLGQTPVNSLSSQIPIILTPILRAGLVLSDQALSLLPQASVYHIGLYRDEETLKPVTYYNKLPKEIDYANARVFILDPMLATGGSAIAAVEILKDMGVQEENLRLLCIIAAPEGIEAVSAQFPGIKVYTAAVDERLNENGFIVPGLGDAGDRTFGTMD